MPAKNFFRIHGTALLVTLFILPSLAPASGAENSAAAGRWIVSADFFGTPLTFILVLEQTGEKLTGDFELNGNALETSMDVEFTVDVLPAKHSPVRGWNRPRTLSRWAWPVRSMTLFAPPLRAWRNG